MFGVMADKKENVTALVWITASLQTIITVILLLGGLAIVNQNIEDYAFEEKVNRIIEETKKK